MSILRYPDDYWASMYDASTLLSLGPIYQQYRLSTVPILKSFENKNLQDTFCEGLSSCDFGYDDTF